MKKVSMWSVMVVAIFMMTMMFALQSQAQLEKGPWSLGVPELADVGYKGGGAIVTEAGTVKKIEKMAGVKDGLQMRLVTEHGVKWLVYMGPKWFIENQKLKFAAGDTVEVRGMKYRSVIIAAEISKGNWTMKLRNEDDGFPSWECCFPRSEKKEE
jgi:hypothetical protein